MPTNETPSVDPRELRKAFDWCWNNPALFARMAAAIRLFQSAPTSLPDMATEQPVLFRALASCPLHDGVFDPAEIKAACAAGGEYRPPPDASD